jgi:enhancing lycopene biosynthesis protein 2
MKKVAVILAGCGHMDGSEIRESVITLLELDKQGAKTEVFAPDLDQNDVIDHVSGKVVQEKRNMLIEAARIARGKIKPIEQLNVAEFDALIMPGGFGVAKNLSTIPAEGSKGKVASFLVQTIETFTSSHKPVGSICISPALVAVALKNRIPTMTLGNESDLLEQIGVDSRKCDSDKIIVDEKNLLVTTPAYMHDDRISLIAEGISKLVKKVLELA